MHPMSEFTAFITDERAVTAIEYGLLAALIVVTMMVGLSAAGTSIIEMYNYWSDAVVAALTGA